MLIYHQNYDRELEQALDSITITKHCLLNHTITSNSSPTLMKALSNPLDQRFQTFLNVRSNVRKVMVGGIRLICIPEWNEESIWLFYN